jgi:hypothetical protein
MERKVFIAVFIEAQSRVPIQSQINSVQISTLHFIKLCLISILKLWFSGLWHSVLFTSG